MEISGAITGLLSIYQRWKNRAKCPHDKIVSEMINFGMNKRFYCAKCGKTTGYV